MKASIASELKKLTTTKGIYLLLAGVVALATVTVLDPSHDAATFRKPFEEQTFVLFTAMLTRLLILVLGIRSVTDELRYGTIVPTLLATPRRTPMIAAKGIVVAGAGAVLGTVSWVAMATAASFVASSDGATLQLGAGAWRSLAGMAGAGAAWAIVGLGLGTVVRSQVAAVVGGLVWLMVLEDGVRGWFGDLAGYLPGQAGLAVTTAPSGKVMAVGAATLAAYAAVATIAATRAIRRDVT